MTTTGRDGALAALAARLVSGAPTAGAHPARPRRGSDRTVFAAHVAARRWNELFGRAFRALTPPRISPVLRRLTVDAVLAAADDEAAGAAITALIADERVAIVAGGFHLLAATAAGRPPELERASALAWINSLLWIMDDCEPEQLQRMLPSLLPVIGRWRTSTEFAAMMADVPPRRPGDRFRDRTHAPIQLARSPDGPASALLVCIAGAIGRIGMPVKLFHRWAATHAADVLYLRAEPVGGYASGVPDLVVDGKRAADVVRAVVDALGVARIGVYGNSGGAFPGVALGLEVGAQRMTAAAGTTKSAESLPRDRHAPDRQDAERRALAESLGAMVTRSATTSEILCIYSDGNGGDRDDAAVLADIPGVRLQALSGAEHNVGRKLVLTGGLGPILGWTAGRYPTLDPAIFDREPPDQADTRTSA